MDLVKYSSLLSHHQFSDFMNDSMFDDLESTLCLRKMLSEASKNTIFCPAASICSSNCDYSFQLDLPGLTTNDINIVVDDSNNLVISGKQSKTIDEDNETCYVYERHYGLFSRSFPLPPGVITESIGASLNKGILLIRFVWLQDQEQEQEQKQEQ
jgi:HSP20 family protein